MMPEADGGWAAKRQHLRVPVSFPVQFLIREPLEARTEFGTAPAKATAEDLSEGGMGILCAYPVPEGALLELRFSLVNTELSTKPRAFEVAGDVRYRDFKERQFRIGVRFLNLPDPDRQFLSQYVLFVQSSTDL